MPLLHIPTATAIPLLAEEFSGDESFAFLVSIVLGAVILFKWWWPLFRVATFGRRSFRRLVLAFWPVFCLGILFVVLRIWSAKEVRDEANYLTLFMVMGAAWLIPLIVFAPYCGVSFQDDVVERDNLAAAITFGGAALGITLSFAGGNIGEGPTIWTTVVSAMLSSGTLLLIWQAQSALTPSADAIAIDRDLASGLRLASLLTACGLILGRSVAGDWHSMDGTLHDWIVTGWPSVVLVALAMVVDVKAAPTPNRPTPDVVKAGAVPAAAYLVAAGAWVAWLGHW